MDKGIPVISLAATNLDGLMAIILWMVFMTLELGGDDAFSVALTVALQIALGAAFGWLIGWLAVKLFDRYLAASPFWLRAALFLLLCVLVFFSGQVLPINAPIVLLVFGLYFVNVTKLEMRRVGRVVSHLWAIAAIFLFVLIWLNFGFESDLSGRVGWLGHYSDRSHCPHHRSLHRLESD